MDGLSSTSCPHPFDEGAHVFAVGAAFAAAQRAGPNPAHYDPLKYGGSAVIHAAWGRRKAELIAACRTWHSPLGILAVPTRDTEVCRRGR